MKPNPPIKGHELLQEGHVFPIHEGWEITGHSGGCRCGAKPPEFPNVSTVQMKKWHREHKEELRGHVVISEYGPLYQEGHLSMYRDAWPADAQNCQVGVQVASDGRIWICIDGASFLRFKPGPICPGCAKAKIPDDRDRDGWVYAPHVANCAWQRQTSGAPGPGEPGDASDAT